MFHSSGVAGGSQLIPADSRSPSTMVWSTGRHIADGAAAVHITTTAYRSDFPLGLIVEWRLVWPGLYSCYCCWETRQLGPELWHGSEIVRTLLLLADQTTHQGPGYVAGAGIPRDFDVSAGAVGRSDCLQGSK